MADAEDWLTADTGWAELVLCSVPIDRNDDPADALLDSLSDPVNYAGALDVRQTRGVVADA